MTVQCMVDTMKEIADKAYELYDVAHLCFTAEMWDELLQVRARFEALVIEIDEMGIDKEIFAIDYFVANNFTEILLNTYHNATFKYPWEN